MYDKTTMMKDYILLVLAMCLNIQLHFVHTVYYNYICMHIIVIMNVYIKYYFASVSL